jgi:uncharacterized protein YunC (DUF1805 family)
MNYIANGKMENDIKKINGIKELIGMKARNVFGVKTIEDLDEKMADLSLVDLQKMAVASGISGGGNRTVLKTKIRSEFLKFMRGNQDGLQIDSPMKLKGKDKKERELEARSLMMEGF